MCRDEVSENLRFFRLWGEEEYIFWVKRDTERKFYGQITPDVIGQCRDIKFSSILPRITPSGPEDRSEPLPLTSGNETRNTPLLTMVLNLIISTNILIILEGGAS
jgi:hypothetical protein